MTPFPERDPSPVDPPENSGDEYEISPFPKHWSEMANPEGSESKPETYAVGEEVPEGPYHAEAKTWREVVAANGRPRSEAGDDDRLYEVGPQTVAVQRRSRILALLREDVAAKLRANEDGRIGKLVDPRRFTLTRLFFVFTLASIVLAVGARFPRGAFAGASGLAALATAILSRWLIGGSAIAQLAWGTLMAIYLLASLFSLLNL
ncbi:MAG: hypothetical protein K8U03_08870 [Planctomycetia bacterium]|nr:hypothetical protein [Planctomycetia bacterium]